MQSKPTPHPNKKKTLPKKAVPLLLILALLAALLVGSEQMLGGIFDEIEGKINATEAALQQEDFDTAALAAADCIAYYTAQEKVLVFFVPSEDLHLFQASIYGMQTYIAEGSRTEALAEAARAHAQLSAVSTMYFRLL